MTEEEALGSNKQADIDCIAAGINRDLELLKTSDIDAEWGSSGRGFDLQLTKAELLQLHDQIWELAKRFTESKRANDLTAYRFHWLLVPGPGDGGVLL